MAEANLPHLTFFGNPDNSTSLYFRLNQWRQGIGLPLSWLRGLRGSYLTQSARRPDGLADRDTCVCPSLTAAKGQIVRKHILRSLFWTLILSLNFTPAALAKEPDEIELALTAIGTGAAIEIKNRLCTDRITIFNDEARSQAIAVLPASIRDAQIKQGKLLQRVEAVYRPLLQLHGRNRQSQQPQLFLFENEIPTAQIWRGCVLLVSTGLADPLYDGELAGIFAHELSHAYFEDEMAAAQRQRDERAMRIIELKCDGVALVSLKLLDYNPTLYLKGLQRIQFLTKRLGRSNGILQSHPDLVVRAQFAQRFIQLLG